jgi:hypothetical protein
MCYSVLYMGRPKLRELWTKKSGDLPAGPKKKIKI